MGGMTPKERLIASALLEEPDTVPVQPELWSDWTAPFFKVARGKAPLWKLQIKAANYFDCEGWFVVGLGESPEDIPAKSSVRYLEDGSEEVRTIYKTPKGDLQTVRVTPIQDAGFTKESLVKSVEEDIEKLECLVFVDPWSRDTKTIEEAIKKGGDQGGVSVSVSTSFFDFWAGVRDGGFTQAMYDFYDYPERLRQLHKKYLDHAAETAKAVLARTNAGELLGGGANASIANPGILEEWDVPVIKSVLRLCKEYVVPFHCHIHGKSKPCLPIMAKAAQEVGFPITISPMEPPPKGDIDDWKEIKENFGRQICFRGSRIDTLRILAQGTPDNIERAVKSTIMDAAEGGGLIVSGEGEPRDTPLENMWAYIRSAREYGKYPIRGH